jgi:hypothetical protein
VLLNATTRRDEQGNVIGVVGIGQDVGYQRAFVMLDFHPSSSLMLLTFKNRRSQAVLHKKESIQSS